MHARQGCQACISVRVTSDRARVPPCHVSVSVRVRARIPSHHVRVRLRARVHFSVRVRALVG